MAGVIICRIFFNGVSVCDQEDADRKIPELLKIPGKKWISIEPCLSHISLRGYDGKIYRPWLDTHAYPKMIDLIVIGAESGPKRRTCKIEWMIDAVKQCKSAGVPVFVKQIQDSKGKVIHDINLFSAWATGKTMAKGINMTNYMSWKFWKPQKLIRRRYVMKDHQKVKEANRLFDRIIEIVYEGPDDVGWVDTLSAIEKQAREGVELTKEGEKLWQKSKENT